MGVASKLHLDVDGRSFYLSFIIRVDVSMPITNVRSWFVLLREISVEISVVGLFYLSFIKREKYSMGFVEQISVKSKKLVYLSLIS
jgi:hypothetical protein